MFEAIEIIRKLFRSKDKDVKHDGRFYKLDDPSGPPTSRRRSSSRRPA
jgi:alkanesulfonate monooxygenase SsuD/methylene tetrahydromethanopterin reductase-like flavin-dependent oxidoreductase (luciferase family)